MSIVSESLQRDTAMIDVWRCSACDLWVASYGDYEVEAACPLVAVHQALLLALQGVDRG